MATSEEIAAQRNVLEYCIQLDITPMQTLRKLLATDKNTNLFQDLLYLNGTRVFLMDGQENAGCWKSKESERSADTNNVGCHQ